MLIQVHVSAIMNPLALLLDDLSRSLLHSVDSALSNAGNFSLPSRIRPFPTGFLLAYGTAKAGNPFSDLEPGGWKPMLDLFLLHTGWCDLLLFNVSKAELLALPSFTGEFLFTERSYE